VRLAILLVLVTAGTCLAFNGAQRFLVGGSQTYNLIGPQSGLVDMAGSGGAGDIGTIAIRYFGSEDITSDAVGATGGIGNLSVEAQVLGAIELTGYGAVGSVNWPIVLTAGGITNGLAPISGYGAGGGMTGVTTLGLGYGAAAAIGQGAAGSQHQSLTTLKGTILPMLGHGGSGTIGSIAVTGGLVNMSASTTIFGVGAGGSITNSSDTLDTVLAMIDGFGGSGAPGTVTTSGTGISGGASITGQGAAGLYAEYLKTSLLAAVQVDATGPGGVGVGAITIAATGTHLGAADLAGQGAAGSYGNVSIATWILAGQGAGGYAALEGLVPSSTVVANIDAEGGAGAQATLGTIQYFGRASTPSDNGTNTASPTAVTPPSNMQAGDLVIMVAQARSTTGTESISQAGGQTWTSETQQNASNARMRLFWCAFNGTWSANPSVTMGSTTNNIVTMHVFRPPSTSMTWSVDTALASADVAAPGSPYTVTIPSTTTNNNNALAFRVFAAIDDVTWSSLTGSTDTWYSPGYYRNTSGSDASQSVAWEIKAAAGATGTVSQNESLSTAGRYMSITFYAH
jgi:hypothetical protein